jgi:hypothetical protein
LCFVESEKIELVSVVSVVLDQIHYLHFNLQNEIVFMAEFLRIFRDFFEGKVIEGTGTSEGGIGWLLRGRR